MATSATGKSLGISSIFHFVKMSIPEMYAYIRYLRDANFNEEREEVTHKDAEESVDYVIAPFLKRYRLTKIVQDYYQLPCSPPSRRRRVGLLEELGLKDEPIALLGDDDGVSWELAQRDFSDVLVADCDPNLIERLRLAVIEVLPRKPRLKIEFMVGDFSDANFKPNRFFKAACIDPPYNPEGAAFFIDAAERILKKGEASHLLLMINPFSLSKQEFLELKNYLVSKGFVLSRQYYQHNYYRLRGVASLTLRFFISAVFLNAKIWLKKRVYFVSDCLHFSRES